MPVLRSAKPIIPRSASIVVHSPRKTIKSKIAFTAPETYQTSPFPTFPSPSLIEADRVHAALVSLHGAITRPAEIPLSSFASGCGHVQSVLDALVRTVLSQNTTGNNSTRAMHAMYSTFGHDLNSGQKPSGEFWEKVVNAPHAMVEESIRCGGLAKTKATVIQGIIKAAKDRFGSPPSLDKLHDLPDREAMQMMMSFPGVGPKTASCVLLFCLGRDSFALDTHILRISRMLDWIPHSANREQAQAHLDTRLPNHLKYPLHVLMIMHGKQCSACKAAGKSRGTGPKAECVLNPWKGKKSAKDMLVKEEFFLKSDPDPVKEPGDFDGETKSLELGEQLIIVKEENSMDGLMLMKEE